MTLSASLTLLASCGKKKVDLDTLSGSELLIALHEQMMEDHKTYIKYSAYASYVNGTNAQIDRKSESDERIVGFYTGKLQTAYTGFTREHVWACANSNGLWTHNEADKKSGHYVDASDYKGGGSDLYHVRPCTNDINTKRGNAKLYEFPTTEKSYSHSDTGPYVLKTDTDGDFANKCEIAKEMKGDMARILMYVYTHYSTIGDNSDLTEKQRSYLGGLNLRDVFNSSYSLKQVQDMLVRWNEEDPVDETEKLRNDTVEKIQGNRNPYVDHPEYIKKIFQEDTEE